MRTMQVSATGRLEWIEAAYGRLDILVNNAGTASVARRGAPPSQTSLDDMRAVYEIDVFGVVAVTNTMLPLLRRADRQRVQRSRLDHLAE
jgi:NAD(P)-dependent dehydrogenase (short-subunit alcohol dehydrogenase family)